jgi:hypothetical protein
MDPSPGHLHPLLRRPKKAPNMVGFGARFGGRNGDKSAWLAE